MSDGTYKKASRPDAAFRDRELAGKLTEKIRQYHGKPVKLMEVCGTHTMSISRYGIRKLLPEGVRLISGPGCPVCVTPSGYVEAAVRLARQPGIIIATFGDMLRIPSGAGEEARGTSLLMEKAKGCDIRMVYSPLDCIELARQNPNKKVVFLAVGFETTIPVIALSLLQALENGAENYMLLSANKTMPAALHLLSSDPDIGVGGYLYPGHVSTIIGESLYREIAAQYHIPGVITGFEPLDILGAVTRLLEFVQEGKAEVENQYSRVVRPEGNPKAVETMNRVFEPCDAVWRGIGNIQGSGLRLRKEYQDWDAWNFVDPALLNQGREPAGCRCGDILKGKCSPGQCGLFGKACTPENPVGSCMVSSEGTCAAYYRYR